MLANWYKAYYIKLEHYKIDSLVMDWIGSNHGSLNGHSLLS